MPFSYLHGTKLLQMTKRTTTLSALLIFGGMIAGFIFLLRGCLAKYDERYASPPSLYFEKNGQSVVFSLVTFEKTTSYSRKGGMTRRSVSTRYYVQNNDGATGAKLKQVMVKKHSQIKNYPVEVMGAGTDLAWVFMGELMAFDPFTLNKVADISVLESKNPQLRGRFPAERKFYEFRAAEGAVYCTANDGSKWRIHPQTFIAEPAEYEPGETGLDAAINRLEMLEKENQAQRDSLYQQKNLQAVALYRQQKINAAEYSRLTKEYFSERKLLDEARDSLRKEKYAMEQRKSGMNDLLRAIENLNRGSMSFSQMKVNGDTLNGRWYGLYAPEEQKEMTQDYFYYRALYNETARRKFYTAAYRRKDGRTERSNTVSGGDVYLDGGFLLDKTTARPMYWNNGHMIVYKNQVGNEGQILLNHITGDGKKGVTITTPLNTWTDWRLAGNRLIVTGVNNKELSSSQVNLLLIINLNNGQVSQYDFFRDK